MKWHPTDDNRRSSSQSERDFKEDLENFFETASCTKFDRDIQDYYEGKGSRDDYRRENFERYITDIESVKKQSIIYVFLSLFLAAVLAKMSLHFLIHDCFE